MSGFFQETWGQLWRWLLHLKREPFNLTFSLLQPLIFFIFFGSAFERMVASDVTDLSYRAYILGGVLTLNFFGNSMAGGIPLLFDKESGFLSRALVAPISRSSIILSRFLFVNLVSALQTIIILVLAHLFGVCVGTGLIGVVLLIVVGWLVGLGLTVLSLTMAFKLTGHGDFFALLGMITLPVTFLSTAFVPLDRMPGWMSALTRLNPLTYAVDAMRALVVQPQVDFGLLARQGVFLLLFDVIMLVLGVRALRRALG